MTTKTMDWEEYLANLESADEQNYKRLFGEEYIKKSDVKTIISRIENINIAVDSWEQIEELPTINLSAIDEMIEKWKNVLKRTAKGWSNHYDLLVYTRWLNLLKQRLSITK